MKPQIYVKVREDGFGQSCWLYRDEDQHYLVDNFYGKISGEIMPTPAGSAKEARRWAREAKSLMEWDGAPGNVKASFWRFVRGKLVETKFTKDGKIKR